MDMALGSEIKRTVVLIGMLSVLLASVGHAQTTPGNSTTQPKQPAGEQEELKRQIRELKEGQEAIRKELQEIKLLLLARAAPPKPAPPEKVSINERPFRGNENARVVVLE